MPYYYQIKFNVDADELDYVTTNSNKLFGGKCGVQSSGRIDKPYRILVANDDETVATYCVLSWQGNNKAEFEMQKCFY